MLNKKDNQDGKKKFSEQDIQQKLYGNVKRKRKTDKNISNIDDRYFIPKKKVGKSVLDVKRKLYGNFFSEQQEEKKKISEQNFSKDFSSQKKEKLAEPEKPVETEKIVEQAVNKQKQEVQLEHSLLNKEIARSEKLLEENRVLQDKIFEVEKKVISIEQQNKKLEHKMLQQQKTSQLKENILNLIYDKISAKPIIAFLLVIIFILFAALLNPRETPSSSVSDKNLPVESKVVVKASNVKQLQPRIKTTVPAKPVQVRKKVVKQKILPVKLEKKEVKKVQMPELNLYTIQVGEYAAEEAAMRFVRELKNQGFKVIINTIDVRGRPYFKISVGLFKSVDAAKKVQKKLELKTGIYDSFIKRKK
ncbi:MAG: hypothetical protein DRP78_07080 [Candidatus Omnitrophota bacterium]|nr:MAG: hypothetical protein DRP78_07080 [Candidatus Omnitrophota bacterium]